jgi:hypothetical protein
VAVVGSRAASKAGRGLAMQVAAELVGVGYVVLSGLAAGIDTAADCSAFASGGRTLAVIGTDLQSAYPSENAWLQPLQVGAHIEGNGSRQNRCPLFIPLSCREPPTTTSFSPACAARHSKLDAPATVIP